MATTSTTKDFTGVEKSVTSEHHLFSTIFHIPADAVLGVAWRIQTLHRDTPQLESLAILWCLRNSLRILASNDLEVRQPKLASLIVSLLASCKVLVAHTPTHQFLVSAGMVPMAAVSHKFWRV